MSEGLNCLFLSEEDLKQAGSLDMVACVEVMEEAFELVGKGDYLMGGPSQNEHGQKLFFPLSTPFENMPVAGPDRRFMTLIGYLGGDMNAVGMKWYGSNPENAKHGLPRSTLMVALNDVVTGMPLAIMSGNTISAMRTGAIVGLASKYIKKDPDLTIGIIGAGVISKACVMALAAALPSIKEVKIYDLYEEKSTIFAEEMNQKLGLNMTVVHSMEEVIKGSDIINAAGSGAHKPFIKKEWLKEGALLTLPGAVDLEDGIMNETQLVVDEWKMHQAYFDQNKSIPTDDPRRFSTSYLFDMIDEGVLKEEEIISLGKLVDQKDFDIPTKKYNIFITGGMPIQDVAWSHYLYTKAKEKNIGTSLNFWENGPALK